jgi:MOSC domain-containing protein YiiM
VTNAKVLSVNLGSIREVQWRGRTIRTAIWKEPIQGPVALSGINLEGDAQADRSVHGGDDKAVYAYAIEDYRYWSGQGVEVHPGLFGENLTLEGVDLGAVAAGEVWQVGTAVLQVTQPRLPCYKLGIRLGDVLFPKRFFAAGRMGAYLRIVEPGRVQAGDTISAITRPAHQPTLREMLESRGTSRER